MSSLDETLALMSNKTISFDDLTLNDDMKRDLAQLIDRMNIIQLTTLKLFFRSGHSASSLADEARRWLKTNEQDTD